MNPQDTRLRTWIDGSTDPPRALLCLGVAAAFNFLEESILAEIIADECTYSSQAVEETLAGGETLREHFSSRFARLRDCGPECLVTAELAADPAQGAPCVLFHQRESAYGRAGIGRTISYLSLTSAEKGKATAIRLVTTLPPPERCVPSGLFPGISDEEIARRRDFQGAPLPRSENVSLLFFTAPEAGVCEDMKASVEKLKESWAPAVLREVPSSDEAACAEHFVGGFPSLVIKMGERVVRTIGGYRTEDQLREELAGIFEA